MTTFTGIDEQDYINISDLNKVRIANEILKSIIPDNSTMIGKNDHAQMIKVLSSWEENLYNSIIIK